VKRPKKLRPSGVICSILVDPDASSEEDLFEQMGKGASKKASMMELEALEQQRREKKEAARQKEK